MKSVINLYSDKSSNFTESRYNHYGNTGLSVFNNILPPMASNVVNSEFTITSAKIQYIDMLSTTKQELIVQSETTISNDLFEVRKDKFYNGWFLKSPGSVFDVGAESQVCRVVIETDLFTFYSELFEISGESISLWFFRGDVPPEGRVWSPFGLWTNSETDIWE